MKILLNLFVILIFSSCGKSIKNNQDPSVEVKGIQGYLDLSNGLVGSSDLLTVTLDIPIEISGDKIIIQSTRYGQDVGQTITCSASFTEAEVYTYDVTRQKLNIRKSNGQSYTMDRMNESGNDIIGSWTWVGVEKGMHIHRRFTFLSSGKLIMNMDCES